MTVLPDRLLDFAGALSAEQGSEVARKLRAAIDDYTNVCGRLEENGMNSGERAEWEQIRNELVNEIVQLTDRLRQPQQSK